MLINSPPFNADMFYAHTIHPKKKSKENAMGFTFTFGYVCDNDVPVTCSRGLEKR